MRTLPEFDVMLIAMEEYAQQKVHNVVLDTVNEWLYLSNEKPSEEKEYELLRINGQIRKSVWSDMLQGFEIVDHQIIAFR
jgi:hypothetical protein